MPMIGLKTYTVPTKVRPMQTVGCVNPMQCRPVKEVGSAGPFKVVGKLQRVKSPKPSAIKIKKIVIILSPSVFACPRAPSRSSYRMWMNAGKEKYFAALTFTCKNGLLNGLSEFYYKKNCCWLIKQKEFEFKKFSKMIFEIFNDYKNYNEKFKNLEEITKKNTWNNINNKIIEIIDEN